MDVDDDGRYIIAQGKLCGMMVTILDIYGPNVEDPDFYEALWIKVYRLQPAAIVCGGDFNVLLNPEIDCHTSADPSVKKSCASC